MKVPWINNSALLSKIKDHMNLNGKKEEVVLIVGDSEHIEDCLKDQVKEIKKIGTERLYNRLPFESDFHAVIFNHTLRCIPGYTYNLLNEAWRILRAGGRIIICEDIPIIPRVFKDYAEFVCSFDNRLVFNRDDIIRMLFKFEHPKDEEVVIRQYNINSWLDGLSDNEKEKAKNRLEETSVFFKNCVNFYADPFSNAISIDIKIYIGSAMKNIKEGMYNWGWWDGPDRFQNVNRNVINNCQRDVFFDVAAKLAPAPVGVNIGGPAHERHGIKVYGLDIENGSNITADGSELPFKDNSVNFFISSHALEHIIDVPKAMREWMRALKPGGLIAATIPDVRYFKHNPMGVAKQKDLAPNEMTPDQFKEIIDKIPELEILLLNSHQNNFDFNVLMRKRS